MDNRSSLDPVCPVFIHFERRQKTTYHISRIDDAIYLVLLAEGVKSSSLSISFFSIAFSPKQRRVESRQKETN
ncbi:unnamed protein product [Peronospora belbahrii]|uniref:Uncharacterized protein n=1 Tax=Peronospora belbahrii TaxID=622444 RepID=A0ABN8CS51_9STRA|nr:unnamed protein product [Peronospora belbahrii]